MDDAERRMTGSPGLARVAGLAALAAPLLMWSEFLTMGILRRGYNLLTSAASDLATRGTPHAGLFDAGFFILPGALTTMLAVGVWQHTNGGSRAWRLGTVLLGVAGLFLVLTGVFRQDPSSPSAGTVHGLMSQICFAAATVAMLALAWGRPDRAGARPPRAIWLAAAAVTLLAEGVNLLLRQPLHIPYGLFQRSFTVGVTVWFVTTAVWLLASARSSASLKGRPAPG